MLNMNHCTLGRLYLLNCFLLFGFFPSRCVVIYSWKRESIWLLQVCGPMFVQSQRQDAQSVFSMLNPLVSTVVTGGDLLDFHMKGIPYKLANVGSVRWRIKDLLSMVISAPSSRMSLGRCGCLVQIIWSFTSHPGPTVVLVEDCLCHGNIPFSAFPQLVSSESANQILPVEEQTRDNKIEQLSSFQKNSVCTCIWKIR